MTVAIIMHRRQTRKVKMIAALLVWPFALALTLFLWLSAGPYIEQRFAPVLGKVTAQHIQMTDRRVCWDLDYDKLRPARPVTMNWVFRIKGSAVFLPAVVIRERDGTLTSVANVAPVGHTVTRLCSVVPDDIFGLPGVALEGQIEYRTNHSFWTLTETFPPVPVPVSGTAPLRPD